MRKGLVLMVLGLAISCGSTTTYEYPDVDLYTAPDPGQPQQDTTQPTPDMKPRADNQPQPDIQYSTSALLEYQEPHGDDNIPCQGFKDPPANSHKVDQCNFEMSYNQERAFKVIYFEDGMPVPSQEVQWELLNAEAPDTGAPIATIDAKSSGTDMGGIASVKVTTKDLMGQFQLKATAMSARFNVAPLYFNIVILPKSVEPLTVKFKHEGGAMVEVVKAYLFLQDVDGAPNCAHIDPNIPPIADKASPEFNDLLQSWKVPSFPDLGPDHPLMYTVVATGYKVNGPVLAWGCNDVDALVEFGKSKMVTIVLHDVPPKYKGVFQVVNHFSILSALPDEVQTVLEFIIDFFNSPTAGLMKLACVLADSTLEDLCDNVFQDPNDPDINNLTTVGTVIKTILDGVLIGLLEDNVGIDIWSGGKDVGNMIQDIEIHSTIKIKAEPDETGFISMENTEEEWHTVSFQWTMGEDCNILDPECGKKSYSFNAIGQDVAVAQFDAQVEGWVLGQFNKLIIYPHSINFKYGAFLNFAIEKLLLPMVAGDGSDSLPVVDSYEKFFYSLLGGKECLQINNCCELFAQNVSGQAGNWVESLAKMGCQALVPLASEYLRDLLTGLDADTGDNFTIGTKDGQPCVLYDTNNDQVIDQWGKKEPIEMRCMWDVKLKLGGNDVFFDADFWGTKQQ